MFISRFRDLWPSITGALALTVVACAGSTSGSAHANDEPCIYGRVVGPDGPLDEVRVTTEPPTDAKLTMAGNFRICEFATTSQPLTPGKYKLTAFKQGWRPTHVEVEYDGDSLEIEDIQLASNDPNDPVVDAIDVPVSARNKNGVPINGTIKKDE